MSENQLNTNTMCTNIAKLEKVKLDICKIIAEERKKAGMTQSEAAKWFEMSARTYCALEKGICTFENLLKVSEKFSIEININYTTN